MAGAKPLPRAKDLSEGVGEVNAGRSVEFQNPPTANKALRKFVASDPITGAPIFNAASWAEAARGDASWAEASWDSASWAEASWSDASWATASWDSSSSAMASWADMSLGSASWADNAEGETADTDGGLIDPLELEAILAGTLDP